MNKIICPKCQAVLNPDRSIILSAKNKDNKWGLVLLSSELGDYTVLNHKEFIINKGDTVEFYCPACHHSLSNLAPKKNLVVFEMIDNNNLISTILISNIAGEKCTCKITEGKIESFGEDANKYKFDYQSMVDLL